ncbi:MAG: VacJ family lipoprotein [Pseudomonadota bacterium]
MKLQSIGRATAALFVAATLSACATTEAVDGVYDPYQPLNRDFHEFNKGLDTVVVRPVSSVYGDVTPGLVRLLIGNALSHLELPRDFANNVFMGKWEPAGSTLARFAVNTIVGAGGLLDPATDFEIEKQDADFGMTLAHYGAGEGAYWELPFLGPGTTRSHWGRFVDFAFAPTTYIGAPISGYTVLGLNTVEFRDTNENAVDSVLYESADSYTTARSLFLQNRRAQLGEADDGEEVEIIAE